MLQVNEIFGPTVQGEGKSIGRPVMFLRLGGNPTTGAPGCNQHCIWCDTAYTWRYTDQFPHNDNKVYDPAVENALMRPEEVIEELSGKGLRSLVISGGEPMLFQGELIPVLEELHRRGWWIEIETAGTITPNPVTTASINQYNISPKLLSSGNPLALRYRPHVIDALRDTGIATWKFVACNLSDFDEIDNIVYKHKLAPVYVMPEGVTDEALEQRTKDLINAIIYRGYFLSPRLHIQLWENKRGH